MSGSLLLTRASVGLQGPGPHNLSRDVAGTWYVCAGPALGSEPLTFRRRVRGPLVTPLVPYRPDPPGVPGALALGAGLAGRVLAEAPAGVVELFVAVGVPDDPEGPPYLGFAVRVE